MDSNTAEESARVLKAQANSFFTAKQYDRAADIYSEIIEQYGSGAQTETIRIVRCNRAQCYLKLEKFELAAEDCNAVLRDTSSTSKSITLKAHLRLARSLHGLDQASKAIEELDKFRALNGGPTPDEQDFRKKLNSILQPPPQRSATMRPLRYTVQIIADPPIIIDEQIPAALCTSNPPEAPSKKFLTDLVTKHDRSLMRRQTWTCWNCPKRATCMTHTPCAYFHLPEPMVVDYVQPVCVKQGLCDMEARQFMAEEMAKVTAAFPRH